MGSVIFIRDLIMVFECSDCDGNWLSNECEKEPTSSGVKVSCPSCGGDVEEICSTAERVYAVLFEVEQLEMDTLIEALGEERDEVVQSVRLLLNMDYLFIDNDAVKLTTAGREKSRQDAAA